MLLQGIPDEDIRDEFGLELESYEKLKAKIYEYGEEDIRSRTSEHVYIQYLLNQIQCIKDLVELTESFAGGKQPSAYVGAVRARSEIYDKIIKQGQELGMIKKLDTGAAVADVKLSELSKTELRGLITRELGGLDSLMQSYGDVNISKIETGELHRDAKCVSINSGKTKPHARNKVHGGRRVVKTK